MKYLGFLKKIENTNYSRIEVIAATPQNDQKRLDLLHCQTLRKLFPPKGTVFLQESAAGGLDNCFVLFSYIKKNTSSYRDVYKDKFMLDGRMEKVEILKTPDAKPVQKEIQLMPNAGLSEAERENYDKKIERLQARVKELEEKLSLMNEENCLRFADKGDLYLGESRDVVLYTLAGAAKELEQQTRRKDVLESILAANPKNGLEKKRESLTKLLTSYKFLTDSLRNKLEELGLKVCYEDGKHYKVRYYGDSRYFVTMAKSPSDNQHGDKNLISKILKKML